jgi:hypothetical protein
MCVYLFLGLLALLRTVGIIDLATFLLSLGRNFCNVLFFYFPFFTSFKFILNSGGT